MPTVMEVTVDLAVTEPDGERHEGPLTYLIRDGRVLSVILDNPVARMTDIARSLQVLVEQATDGYLYALAVSITDEGGVSGFHAMGWGGGPFQASVLTSTDWTPWTIGTGPISALSGVLPSPLLVAFLEDGERVLVARSSQYDIWTLGGLAVTTRRHPWKVTGAAFVALTGTLALAAFDRVRLLDVDSGEIWATIPVPDLCPSGPGYAHVYADPFVPLLAVQDGTHLALLNLDLRGKGLPTPTWRISLPGIPHTMAFSREGDRLAVVCWADEDRALTLWDVEEGKYLYGINVTPLPTAVAFSPDGKLLLWGDREGNVHAVNVEDPDSQAPPVLHHDRVEIRGLTFSPNGRLLAVTGTCGLVSLWRAGDWRPVALLERRPAVTALGLVAFSPDGRRVASAGSDGDFSIHVRDLPGRDM